MQIIQEEKPPIKACVLALMAAKAPGVFPSGDGNAQGGVMRICDQRVCRQADQQAGGAARDIRRGHHSARSPVSSRASASGAACMWAMYLSPQIFSSRNTGWNDRPISLKEYSTLGGIW